MHSKMAAVFCQLVVNGEITEFTRYLFLCDDGNHNELPGIK
jgi:hypothetical protein